MLPKYRISFPNAPRYFMLQLCVLLSNEPDMKEKTPVFGHVALRLYVGARIDAISLVLQNYRIILKLVSYHFASGNQLDWQSTVRGRGLLCRVFFGAKENRLFSFRASIELCTPGFANEVPLRDWFYCQQLCRANELRDSSALVPVNVWACCALHVYSNGRRLWNDKEVLSFALLSNKLPILLSHHCLYRSFHKLSIADVGNLHHSRSWLCLLAYNVKLQLFCVLYL